MLSNNSNPAQPWNESEQNGQTSSHLLGVVVLDRSSKKSVRFVTITCVPISGVKGD